MMKARGLTAAILVAGLLFMGGCTQSGTPDPENDIPTASLVVSDPSTPGYSSGTELLATVKVTTTDAAEGGVAVNIKQPVFTGFDAAETLNLEIQQEIDESMAAVQVEAAELQSRTSDGFQYTVDFDYRQNGIILSVVLNFHSDLNGEGPADWKKMHTINLYTGEIYNSAEVLFRDPAKGKKAVEQMIKAYLRSNLDADTYNTAIKKLGKLEENFSFFLKGSDLIIYFDPYTLIEDNGLPVTIPLPLKELKAKAPMLNAVQGEFE